MKVYLSNKKQENANYKWANSLPMLDGVLLDSEGTDVVCDNFVSSFDGTELVGLIKKLVSKLRLKGKLTICDVDSAVLARRMYNQEITEEDANNALFHNQKRKSLHSLRTIIDCLPPNVKVETKDYELQTCRFTLVVRRVS